MKVSARMRPAPRWPRRNIVLPVSDEMDCRACHASGSGAAARPAAGWVNDPDAQRDYRLNILRLHDDRQARTRRSTRPRSQTRRATAPRASTRRRRGGTADPLRGVPRVRGAGRQRASPGIPPLTASMHTLHATRDRPDQRPRARLHAPTARRATAATPGRRRAACAARWATRWRPTARWRSSARTATAR